MLEIVYAFGKEMTPTVHMHSSEAQAAIAASQAATAEYRERSEGCTEIEQAQERIAHYAEEISDAKLALQASEQAYSEFLSDWTDDERREYWLRESRL